MTQPNGLEGLEVAVEAAGRAKERMGVCDHVWRPAGHSDGQPRMARVVCEACGVFQVTAPIVDPALAALERAKSMMRADADALQAEEDRRAEQAAQNRILAMIARVIPAGRHWAHFESPELGQRVASKRAMAASRLAVDKPGIVWTGRSGSGKTSLACATLRAWIERNPERRPLFVPAWKLAVARSRHPLGEGEPELVERAFRADLVVLDEIADQHCATSAVPDVIFEREAEGRSTWVTTWMTADQVSKLLGDGISRRIFERATLIDCGAK